MFLPVSRSHLDTSLAEVPHADDKLNRELDEEVVVPDTNNATSESENEVEVRLADVPSTYTKITAYHWILCHHLSSRLITPRFCMNLPMITKRNILEKISCMGIPLR